MSTRRVKIHYRSLRRDNGQFPAATLSKAIGSALAAKAKDGSEISENPINRITSVPGNESFKRLLNNFEVQGEYSFGTLCMLEPGQMQALLQTSRGSEHDTLEEALKAFSIAETKAPTGHEYLHGMSYWLAIDDHFYQIQHMSIQAKAVEEYLTWLLRDQTSIIGAKNYVELKSLFDRSQIGSDLQSIEIGGFVPETVHEEAADPAQQPQSRAAPQVIDFEVRDSIGDIAAKTFARARNIISELVGDVEADKIIASVPPEAALEVTVNIGYRSRKRKIKKEFMNNLEAGLRNIPDGEIRAIGAKGRVLGDDARLSMDMGVRRLSDTSSLLDPSHARDQMLEVHRRFLYDGVFEE